MEHLREAMNELGSFYNKRVAMESVLPKVADNPDELLAYMNTNQEYGYEWEGKVYHKDYSKYHTRSPKDFASRRIGVCWDFAAYEYAYFKKYFKKIPCKLYYIEAMGSDGSIMTHTWLSYKSNDMFYIIESSWSINHGIHEYANEKEMLDDYIARFLEFNHLNTGAKYTLLEYDMPDEFNQTAVEFMKYVWKHGKVIRDHGLSKLYKRGHE